MNFSKIICQISNIKGGVYSSFIKDFFDQKINKYLDTGLYEKLSILDLGGIYFIEGDFRSVLGEYYKIGMSSSISKKKLLSRIDSYGTYYPFGIKLRGISFTLKSKNINYNDKIIISILKKLTYFHSSENKDELLKKQKDKIKNEELIENEELTEYIEKIVYNYMKDTINETKINYSILNKYLLDMNIKSFEDAIHFNIINLEPNSKNFKSLVKTREDFGEFFNIKSDDLLKIYLKTSEDTNQLLIYFPDEPLLFGKYAKPGKIPKYEIYLGRSLASKKI